METVAMKIVAMLAVFFVEFSTAIDYSKMQVPFLFIRH